MARHQHTQALKINSDTVPYPVWIVEENGGYVQHYRMQNQDGSFQQTAMCNLNLETQRYTNSCPDSIYYVAHCHECNDITDTWWEANSN